MGVDFFSAVLYNLYDKYGEVSEWFKELVLKTSDIARYRGFESHLLRHTCGEHGRVPQVFLFSLVSSRAFIPAGVFLMAET